MSIDADDLLANLEKLNIEGGHWIKQQKKAAFTALVGVAAKDYLPIGKINGRNISNAYKDAILNVLKNHAKVFDFEVDELDNLQNMDSFSITDFENKLLVKYKGFFTAGVDLQKVNEAFDAENAKVTPITVVENSMLDAGIDALPKKMETLSEVSKRLKPTEDEIASAKVALDKQLKNMREADQYLKKASKHYEQTKAAKALKTVKKKTNQYNTAQRKVLELEESVFRLTLEKAQIEELIQLNDKNKTSEPVKKENENLPATKIQPQNNAGADALKSFGEMLKKAVQSKETLSNSNLSTIIKNGEAYEQAIQALRAFEKNKHLAPEVSTALQAAFKPKTKIELSSGTSIKSNLVMSLQSNEIDPWDISKCLDIPESFTELPVNLKGQNTLAFEKESKSQSKSHVFVRAAPKSNDSPSECIVAKKEFTLADNTKKMVVLKQEVDGAKVTNLTEGMSLLKEKDQIEVAMMHAKMLLDNYKPGDTNIAIKFVDSRMAEKVHAALLVMKGDSAAKSCTIENKNFDSKVPGVMESVTGSFCKEILGKDIYDYYKRKYRSEMIKHKDTMKLEFGKEKKLNEYKKPEGDNPGRPSRR